jgi:hypothetical protein
MTKRSTAAGYCPRYSSNSVISPPHIATSFPVFIQTQRNGSQNPSDSDLARCLEDMLRSPGQAPVYLVIDALDECPDSSDTPSPRENVLKLVEDLVNLRLEICGYV